MLVHGAEAESSDIPDFPDTGYPIRLSRAIILTS